MVAVSTNAKARVCVKCGKALEADTLIFDGREVFADRATICDQCADEHDAARAQSLRKTQQDRLVRRWEEICPFRFRDTDPAKLPRIKSMNQIISWRCGPDGILAHGATGMGKTRCLFLLLRRLHFKEHRTIIAIPAADFGLECSRLFSDDQGRAAEFVKRLIRVDVLMVDDLDKARFTERTEAELFHVIDARTAAGKPLLASLNASGEDLATMLTQHRGWPLVRRLRDYCRAVNFDEP